MELKAGPVTVHYENGFLRTFSAGSRELLRMIYFALRDAKWDTAPIRISNERIDSDSDTFQIVYDWSVDGLGMQVQGQVHVNGQTDGRIDVQFRAEALNTFQRNRIGLCILHPIVATSGQPCVITSPDGTQLESQFPDFISPHQPFLNIQTMTWETGFGDTLQLSFSGDVFETEDQRNWTDASFKTYSTPLTIPIPATVEAGTVIEQSVHFQPIKLTGTDDLINENLDTSQNSSVLRIGLGHRIDGPRLQPDEALRLKKLNLSHLRANVFFSGPDWSEQLLSARTDANMLAIPLELALFFDGDAAHQLNEFLTFLSAESASIQSLLLFNLDTHTTSDKLLNELVPMLRSQLPNVKLGGGTDANFAEFNRNPFLYDLVDFVTFSAHPQAHAFDNQTIMENAAAHADVVRSAKKLTSNKPVHISPITLRSRFNPALPADKSGYNPPTDSRQNTDFAAEWTRKSLEAVRSAGADSVTYFETHGPRGVLENDTLLAVLQDR
ncbi:hypothetical protein GCM10028807_48760 [Spirosoma daeguense]